jgi:NAD(P)-dependent dehydrogenase (short-subunit alcohol dehydrogenase family)
LVRSCQLLARRGVDSIFTYNSNRTEADKALVEGAATGRKGVALQLDAGKASFFDALVLTLRHALDTLGAERVDYLVNSAGNLPSRNHRENDGRKSRHALSCCLCVTSKRRGCADQTSCEDSLSSAH